MCCHDCKVSSEFYFVGYDVQKKINVKSYEIKFVGQLSMLTADTIQLLNFLTS